MAQFKASTQGSTGTVSVFFTDGESKTLQSTHPAYAEVLTYFANNPDESTHDEVLLKDMANPAIRIGKMLKAIDSRYDFDMFTLSFEGLPLTGTLADLIKDRLANGKSDWERFAKFLARLEANPSYNAKQALYDFVKDNGLHILADGRFVGHKAVGPDGMSKHSGPNNFINGVLFGKPGVSVRVPHAVGTVVSKRRGDVDDSSMACSTGLHVGSHRYASGFADVLLTVVVAPEDVVGGEMAWKFRTERYEVIGINEDKADFVDGDFDLVDRSDVLTDAEKAFAVGAPLLSHEPVHFEFAEGEKTEFNSLSSAGRNLYLNLRNLLAKSHYVAMETALADHGSWEEFLAKQEAEREDARVSAQTARAADERARLDAEQDAAEAEAVLEEPVETKTTSETVTDALGLSNLATMDEKAKASSDLRRDLLDSRIGHKPLARKWERAGVTDASVRRWRKANDVQVALLTRMGL